MRGEKEEETRMARGEEKSTNLFCPVFHFSRVNVVEEGVDGDIPSKSIVQRCSKLLHQRESKEKERSARPSFDSTRVISTSSKLTIMLGILLPSV